jgi:hypothetical protein
MCTSGSGVRCIGRVLHAFSLTHKKGRRTSTGENQPGRQTKQGVATSNDDRKSDILGIPIERHIQPDLQFALIRILYIQADLADERRMKKDRFCASNFTNNQSRTCAPIIITVTKISASWKLAHMPKALCRANTTFRTYLPKFWRHFGGKFWT